MSDCYFVLWEPNRYFSNSYIFLECKNLLKILSLKDIQCTVPQYVHVVQTKMYFIITHMGDKLWTGIANYSEPIQHLFH